MPRDPDDDTSRDRARKQQRAPSGFPPSALDDDEKKLYNAPNEMGGYRKGGMVKKTGPAKVHKGEEVVKKSSATKYGPAKMAAVNKGTARISTAKRGKR